ncbi:SPW repeat protein [Saccharopolyspora shandongensis]
MALGALPVISPWIVGYSTEPASASSAWSLGGLAVVLGTAALPASTW